MNQKVVIGVRRSALVSGLGANTGEFRYSEGCDRVIVMAHCNGDGKI